MDNKIPDPSLTPMFTTSTYLPDVSKSMAEIDASASAGTCRAWSAYLWPRMV